MRRLTTPLRLLPALAILACAPFAGAKSRLPKVMVLDLSHDETLKTSTMTALNAYLAGAVRDEGFSVITPSQIGAVLGVEKQRELLGCSETSCLAELGGAMGVDFIVQGSIGILSKDSIFTLTLVDKRGITVSSQRTVAHGTDPDQLVPAIQQMVPKLMAPAHPRPPPDLVSPPQTASNAPIGGLTESKTPPESASGHPTGAYLLLGTGVVLVAASVVTGLMANSKASAYRSDIKNGSSDDAKTAQSSANTLALGSTVALGAGLVSLGAGGIWFFTSGSGSEEQQ